MKLNMTSIDIQNNSSTTRFYKEKNAGLLFTGYLKIPESGDWTFQCEASGGLIFKIHNKLVLDGDYKYDGSELSSKVKLAAGIHPYRLYYKTSSEQPSLNFQWEGPDTTKNSIPADALFMPRKRG